MNKDNFPLFFSSIYPYYIKPDPRFNLFLYKKIPLASVDNLHQSKRVYKIISCNVNTPHVHCTYHI